MSSYGYQASLSFEREGTLVDRITGALLGAAIGDALGWPQERPDMLIQSSADAYKNKVQTAFQTWHRRAGTRFYRYDEQIREGEYSDDTQLILATLRSLLHGDMWSKWFCSQELPIWLLYERGGGRATKQAAESWLRGSPPWRDKGNMSGLVKPYFNAGGNGVATRILPHAINPRSSDESMQRQIMVNGICTHGHPRALVGALLYGKAIRIALSTKHSLKLGSLIDELMEDRASWSMMPKWEWGFEEWCAAADIHMKGDYAKEWGSVCDEVLQGLKTCRNALDKGALAVDSQTLNEMGCFDKKVKGAGTIAALASIYLASRYAADPCIGVLEAAFAKGADTDTIASMVGGLLGALIGSEWFKPEWERVQDYTYIKYIALSLANPDKTIGSGVDHQVSRWKATDTKRVLNSLQSSDVDTIKLGPLGPAKIVERIDHLPLTKTTMAKSWKLAIVNGQSVYITKVSRVKEGVQQRKLDFTYKRDRAIQYDLETVDLFRDLARVFPENIPATLAFKTAAEMLKLLSKEVPRFKEDETSESTIRQNNVYIADLIKNHGSSELHKLDSDVIMSLSEIICRYLSQRRLMS